MLHYDSLLLVLFFKNFTNISTNGCSRVPIFSLNIEAPRVSFREQFQFYTKNIRISLPFASYFVFHEKYDSQGINIHSDVCINGT
jgi:hypothetical protein